mmetsp:Transcript_6891/g.23221  ORF Transcript_6891/g.23221 Transcript_6891/m.23221 type:complete len:216 (+) Transcript_6891:914-1561(+)
MTWRRSYNKRARALNCPPTRPPPNARFQSAPPWICYWALPRAARWTSSRPGSAARETTTTMTKRSRMSSPRFRARRRTGWTSPPRTRLGAFRRRLLPGSTTPRARRWRRAARLSDARRLPRVWLWRGCAKWARPSRPRVRGRSTRWSGWKETRVPKERAFQPKPKPPATRDGHHVRKRRAHGNTRMRARGQRGRFCCSSARHGGSGHKSARPRRK